jgi:hypothetical protein
MGDIEMKLASAPGRKSNDHLQTAKHLYEQASTVWGDLQKHDKLAPDETNRPDSVSRKLAQCENLLTKPKK